MVESPLNPAAQIYLDQMKTSGRPPLNEMPAPVARRLYDEASPFVTPEAPEVAAVRDFKMAGPHGEIPLRLYRPRGSHPSDVLPSLIYLHGGGWTVGSLATHDVLCRQLANETPCAVISVDYRMGPEHRFPIAVDECVAVTKWVRTEFKSLQVDPNRIAIGGDSAGGNLSAVVALELRDEGVQALCYQLLIYPATDQTMSSKSHVTRGEGYFLTNKLITYFRDNYVDKKDFENWRASPLKARDFSGLPPALVMTAGYDPLIDEGQEYARRLQAAGVAVESLVYPDMIHGFIRLGKVIPDAQNAVADAARGLAKAFKLAPSGRF